MPALPRRPQTGRPTAETALPSRRHGAAVALLAKAARLQRKGANAEALPLLLAATKQAPDHGQAHYLLGCAFETLGELARALEAYERAIACDPGNAEPYLALGLCARKLDMLDAAERFFRLYTEMRPDAYQGHNNLATTLRDKGEYEAAIEILRGALYAMPETPELWNTLGTVLLERGEPEQAMVFYSEALRLDPHFGRVHHNLGYALSHLGNTAEALSAFERACAMLKDADQIEARQGLGLALLTVGRLAEGWDAYEARLDTRFHNAQLFAVATPRWLGGSPAGKRLLIAAEQGVGDEIMFANIYRDLIRAVGPEGRVHISCDPRLAPLFARSFPEAVVGPSAIARDNGRTLRLCPWLKDHAPLDGYVPAGSLAREFRATIADFPPQPGFLVPDPARVAHWRARLEAIGPGPYVGLCWRSGLRAAVRGKYYAPLDRWSPVLKRRDVTFVNLQYDECADELAAAHARFGTPIRALDGIDLRRDLDENAALCAALDLVLSAPTAAGALAGAVGTETWFLTLGPVWPMLGQSASYPWYPGSRVLVAPRFGAWDELLLEIGGALADWRAARA